MQRINTADGNWQAGDPSTGIKGTVVRRDFMQAVQEEIAAVPESVGIKLDPNDNGQLLKAVKKIVGDAGANYQPKLDYVPVQQGTGAGQGANAVKIGWAKDGSGLRVTVDANDLGLVAFASQLAAYASQDWVKGYAVNKAGDTMTGPLTLASAADYSPLILSAKGYAPRIQADNTTKAVTIVNGANNQPNVTVFDDGRVAVRGWLMVGGTTFAGGDNASIAADGNVWGKQWGGWLRNFLDNTFARQEWVQSLVNGRADWNAVNNAVNIANGKANANARVQWDSGVAEWGIMDIGINIAAHTIDIPAPYVMMGMRKEANNTRCYLRGVVLRNQ